MPFTTLSYIAFFAAVFFAYYAIPKRFQWWLLLTASVFFYGFSSPYYLIFLAATIVITYIGACAMDRNLRNQKEYIKAQGKEWSREEKKAYKATMERRRRWMLIGVIVGLIGMLGVFKYGQFLVDNVVWLGGIIGWRTTSPVLNLILPIGLSFYIFQSLGYCIDVQREEVPAERNFFRHALYVSFFPQILQGPIGNYSRLAPQLFAAKSFDYQQAVIGLQRVAWGFFKKLVIANRIAIYVNPVWSNVGDYSGFATWFFFCFMYAIQLYADFSGYMDIACGCSRMLGIKLDENFESPYFTKSIAEFWRKWHITLGVWFKDYVFYPILRSDWNAKLRKRLSTLNPQPSTVNKYLATTLPTVAGLLIVWVLIGLWHGADWSYLIYGLYHGGFIILAVILAPVYDRLHALAPKFFVSKCYSAFQMLRTFIIVVIGYSIFKPADLGLTAKIWASATSLDFGAFMKMWQSHPMGWVMCLGWTGLLALIDLVHLRWGAGILRGCVQRMPCVLRLGIYLLGLFSILYLGLYGEDFNTFEYFKF